MTSDTPETPSFHLPDWGTDGAPPPPDRDDTGADDLDPDGAEDQRPVVSVEVDTSVLLLTTPLPPGWTITNVIGVVSATGSSTKDKPRKALSAATEKALDSLRAEARAQRADGVVGLALSVVPDRDSTTVFAYGTAVGFVRD